MVGDAKEQMMATRWGSYPSYRAMRRDMAKYWKGSATLRRSASGASAIV